MKAKNLILAPMLALTLSATAERHEPLNTTRVMWDISSRQCIFDMGNYGRIIPLNDGRLLAVAETYGTYSGITIAYSNDNGKSWVDKQTVGFNRNNVPMAVPDVIQLSDGTIVVGFNPRPSAPYSEDRHFGIECVRSEDNGKTWSEHITVFEAGHRATEGCWEPSFLELPSGELHCYFANEFPHQGDDTDQEISVCRSFDKGLTWSEPERVCYRQGSRDGMPVSILTDNDEIVVIVEDNGHPGRGGFRATTVRCTLEQNWHDCWVDGPSDNRDAIFDDGTCMYYVSAAPYIRKLPTGETLCSWMGDWYDRQHWPEDRFDVYVGVGDKDGRNVGQISQPFKVSSSEHALWNSVNLGFDNTVFVCSSIGGSNGVYTLTGKALTGFEADYGTPKLDGNSSKETWTAPKARQLFMGQFFRNRSTHDFLYDDQYLYFVSYVGDGSLITEGDAIDGVQLSLDPDNLCEDTPQEGIHTFFIGANGTVEYACGKDGEWHSAPLPDGVECKVIAGRTYYMHETAIPWKAFGLDSAPVGREMRVNVQVRDIRKNGEYRIEPIPDAAHGSSYTWPLFHLNAKSGIVEVPDDSEGSASDAPVTYYNLMGQPVQSPSGGIFIRRQGIRAEKVLLP